MYNPFDANNVETDEDDLPSCRNRGRAACALGMGRAAWPPRHRPILVLRICRPVKTARSTCLQLPTAVGLEYRVPTAAGAPHTSALPCICAGVLGPDLILVVAGRKCVVHLRRTDALPSRNSRGTGGGFRSLGNSAGCVLSADFLDGDKPARRGFSLRLRRPASNRTRDTVEVRWFAWKHTDRYLGDPHDAHAIESRDAPRRPDPFVSMDCDRSQGANFNCIGDRTLPSRALP